jgi:hypothetical protein
MSPTNQGGAVKGFYKFLIKNIFAVDGVPKNVREPTHSLVKRRRLVSNRQHNRKENHYQFEGPNE